MTDTYHREVRKTMHEALPGQMMGLLNTCRFLGMKTVVKHLEAAMRSLTEAFHG